MCWEHAVSGRLKSKSLIYVERFNRFRKSARDDICYQDYFGYCLSCQSSKSLYRLVTGFNYCQSKIIYRFIKWNHNSISHIMEHRQQTKFKRPHAIRGLCYESWTSCTIQIWIIYTVYGSNQRSSFSKWCRILTCIEHLNRLFRSIKNARTSSKQIG